jgi:hypothetical protein
MNFKDFLCEWYDVCYEFKDNDNFLGEEPQKKTVTREL